MTGKLTPDQLEAAKKRLEAARNAFKFEPNGFITEAKFIFEGILSNLIPKSNGVKYTGLVVTHLNDNKTRIFITDIRDLTKDLTLNEGEKYRFEVLLRVGESPSGAYYNNVLLGSISSI
jgi:hypothetical protein